MQDPLRHLPGYALRRAAGAMMAELSERLEPLGRRYSEVSVLLAIDANPGITASQLGRLIDIQRANMVPLLGRLDAAGLIDRAPIDGKSHSLHLSPMGKAELARVKTIIAGFEADLLARIPEPHRDHLKPALDALWLPKAPTSR